MHYWKVLIFALLLLPAMVLVAFGPRADEVAADNRVVVEYWEKWTGNEEAQMRGIVETFNETAGKSLGIRVNYMSTAAINQKLLVAAAAGVPPDLAGVWDSNVIQFAAQGALEPLEDMAGAHGITAETYKPVYWNACNDRGHLWALVSTPGLVALLYNRVAFEENGPALRLAGLDPTRAPRTIAELDAYSDALTKRDNLGRIIHIGYFPMEPMWYVQYTPYWFGADLWNEKTGKFTLTDAGVIKAFTWIQSYAGKMGKDGFADFRNGLGNFDSPQNPFMAGEVFMEQQGPWMANYIEHQKPSIQHLKWPREEEMTKPLSERRKNYAWAVAPFPSAVPGLENVSYATFDALVIPKGARHKKEAFEFMAYLNQQDVMEKLCMMHCKNSPLRKVSDNFLNHHPNPYIDVFEKLAADKNARGIPKVPIWQEVVDELTNVAQRLTLLQTDPVTALTEAQTRLQLSYDDYLEKQNQRQSMAADTSQGPAQ